MLVVGLTGGIGSGKSTVAELFAALGVPVVDADKLARELVMPGSATLEAIIAAFGGDVLDDHGQLDRKLLRRIVFADPHKRKRLEQILHPRIKAEMIERIQSVDAPYCIAVIPLLVEAEQTDVVDRVLVVDAPEDIQIERAVSRDRCRPEEIQRILRSQASRAARLQLADDVIHNDGDRYALARQVERFHQQYLRLARQS